MRVNGNSIVGAFEPLSLLTRKEIALNAVLMSFRILLVALDLFGIALLSMAVAQATGVVASGNSFTGKLISLLGGFGFTNIPVSLGVLSISFFLLKSFLSIIFFRVTTKYLARVETRKATLLFETLIRDQEISRKFDTRHELVRALNNGVDMAIGRYLTMLQILISEAALVIAIIWFLATQDFQLVIYLLVFFALTGSLLYFAVNSKIHKLATLVEPSHTGVTRVASEALEGLRQLYSGSGLMWQLSLFRKHRKQLSDVQASITNVSSMPRYVVEVGIIVAICVIWIVQTNWGIEPVKTGQATLFVASIYRVAASLLPLQSALAFIAQARMSSQTVLAYKKLIKSPREANFEQKILPTYPSIVINLRTNDSQNSAKVHEIAFGDVVRVTGPSGSGKSTLLDLISGFDDAEGVSVLIDGIAATRFARSHQGAIAYVDQSPKLFSASLVENITLGSPAIDLNRVNQLLEKLNLSHLLDDPTNGTGRMVSADKLNLSGGEIQRLAIARALYQRPKILILDEPISALDPESSKLVSLLLAEIRGKATIIFSSHSLNVLIEPDSVISV